MYSNYSERKLASKKILYPAKLSFRYEGEIKALPEKQKLRELSPQGKSYKKC